MFDAIIIGIIQGLTEFLPVSSSAHVLIAEKLLQFEADNHSFAIAIHLATTLAVVIYLWKDILKIISAPFEKSDEQNEHSKLWLYIVAATLPTLIIGFLIKDMAWFEYLSTNLYVIGISLIVFSIILYFADKYSLETPGSKALSLQSTSLIGLSQLIAAIFPGASRSGITLTSGFFFDITREQLTKFVFLISIPVSGLAAVYELFFGEAITFSSNFAIAFVAAFISGILAIHFLLQIVKKYSLKWFCLYRILFGTVVLILAVHG